MKRKGSMDLTQGRPIKQILLFSMPLVLGTLFQQLYSFVDMVMSVLFCFHGSVMLMRNTLQGMGYSFHAVLSGVAELAGRWLCGVLAVKSLGFFGICIANPAAWLLATLYCTVLVMYYLRKRLRGEYAGTV